MPDFCINIFLPFLCQAGWHDLQTIAAQSDLSDLKACQLMLSAKAGIHDCTYQLLAAWATSFIFTQLDYNDSAIIVVVL